MGKEVEVTEAKTNTFRLFNKIEATPVHYSKGGAEATFWVRPMTNTEKSLFDFATEEVQRSRGLAKMIENSGLTADDYEVVNGKSVPTKSALKKITKAVQEIEFDADAEEKYLEAVKKVIVSCTEKGEYDGIEMEFTDEIYEALNGSHPRAWLLAKIEDAGTLTGAERVSL